MSMEKASPAVASLGTQEKRVSFTREQFVRILIQWERDVKVGETEAFIDSVFNGAGETIKFNAGEPAGGRFQ